MGHTKSGGALKFLANLALLFCEHGFIQLMNQFCNALRIALSAQFACYIFPRLVNLRVGLVIRRGHDQALRLASVREVSEIGCQFRNYLARPITNSCDLHSKKDPKLSKDAFS